MFEPAFIEILKERIGFGEPFDLPSGVVVEPKHIEGESGRTFAYFHRLVDLENIYNTTRKIDMDSDEFNAYLDQMKEDSVKAVLAGITGLCIDEEGYKSHLIHEPRVLDDIIGYYLAVTAVEEMVATSRVNREGRNAMFKYDKLKVELEGLRHDSGHIISEGLTAKKFRSMKDLSSRLCGEGIIIEDANFW